jgi:hypothetical protein
MDEHCMLVWVNKFFGPYLAVNPPPEGVQPVLLLDLYRSHMMASVMSRIKVMGVHVIYIPGGCTGLTQPLDVGINQSFKSHCWWIWEEWLTDLLDMVNEVSNAMRKEVSEWVVAVFWEFVGSHILQNTWRKMGFDWFPGVADPDDNVTTDGDECNNGDDDGNGDNDGGEDSGFDDSLFDSKEEEEEESGDDENSENEGDGD